MLAIVVHLPVAGDQISAGRTPLPVMNADRSVPPPVARAVLIKLYELLAPGGTLLLSNFHPRNPSRVYMEYWMDWAIYYRDEAEFLELASDLPDADVSLTTEDTGSQMFLQVRKP